MTADTIVAIATGSGRAGIGIVRVSGPEVPVIAQAIAGSVVRAREAHHLAFLDADGQPIDIGILLRFEAPESFTGEHVLELQGHGGPVVLDLLMQRVVSLGARPALPGEFSERAFLNDKLDLAQAEAVADLIDSSSRVAARAAVRSMAGDFSRDVDALKEALIGLRVWLEAALDFSEEEIDFLAEPELGRRAAALVDGFDALLSRSEQGQRLRDGFNVVIAGVANVGKSSLLNALAGVDTAIVTDVAGTTRDVLHANILLEGIPLHLIDTAGLRETDDTVEREGIARARRALEEADHVLVMIDAANPVMPDIALPASPGRTLLINKIDLLGDDFLPELPEDAPTARDAATASQGSAQGYVLDELALPEALAEFLRRRSLKFADTLGISVRAGQGMDALRDHLLQLAGHDASVEGVYLARRRHLDALYQARQSANRALMHLRNSAMPELAAEELRLGQQALDRITGRFDSDDLLGRIFRDFCVGK